MNFFKKLFGRKCSHLRIELNEEGKVISAENLATTGGNLIISDWGAPEPHPHPKFANRVKVQRQKVAAVSHCPACGKTWIVFGYNQREASDKCAM